MVIIILSQHIGMPEIDLAHYNDGVSLAEAEFEEYYGFRPKFGFMRLGDPKHISIASDPDFVFTFVHSEGPNLN